MNKETFTIVNSAGYHYDTHDQRFYSDSHERTQDTKEYLGNLISNDPEKFDGCYTEENTVQEIDRESIKEGVHASEDSEKVLFFAKGEDLCDDVCKLILNGDLRGLYLKDYELVAQDVWGQEHKASNEKV